MTEAAPLRRISVDEFARRLKDAVEQQDKRFAFFLGAGCSISSGIPSAGGLVKDRWLPRLHSFRTPLQKLESWICEEFPGYDSDKPSASYGQVIEKLFLHPEERQREFEQLCDSKFPGFGYAALASLIASKDGRFNIVLTTNFDDLVADALYLFTDARPLVIPHESLASFIRPTRTRPLVVKLHGDHRLTPMNTEQETEQLEKAIESQVGTLLYDRGLIFMGYGGNDKSVIKMLHSLPKEALPLGVYWVSGSEPQGEIRAWLNLRKAVWVNKKDFDEVMVILHSVFKLAPPNSNRFDKVFQKYMDTYNKVSTQIDSLPKDALDAVALKAALEITDQSLPEWWSFTEQALRLHNSAPEKAQELYLEGIVKFPISAPLIGSYAIFLHTIKKDYEEAERYYRRALEIDANNANHLGNYAGFLLSKGRTEEGLSILDRALNAPEIASSPALLVECWFYSLAHGKPEKRRQALYNLKQALVEGKRSPGWNLKTNIEQDSEGGTPRRVLVGEAGGCDFRRCRYWGVGSMGDLARRLKLWSGSLRGDTGLSYAGSNDSYPPKTASTI
ncbi:SIR2 family protein [Candidatus Cyanaurora vandensis]|uniref:SIR2 family protein n=1 Tax=Candidatus Cyanaurora vandensis TaxID=2714958 RepID=UPI00257B8624|nr:SIR2 family protein [Candidatus Cyanaurora vandensis]